MAGRNDAVLAAALEAMAHAMENQPNADENAGDFPERESTYVQGKV